MEKISQELIERIKTEVKIEQFLPDKFRVTGNKKFYLCPFADHHELKPSFVLYDTNSYHCFGCQRSGDVIQFIMDLTDASFTEAINYLTKFL